MLALLLINTVTVSFCFTFAGPITPDRYKASHQFQEWLIIATTSNRAIKFLHQNSRYHVGVF
jgi:hypothetical protein